MSLCSLRTNFPLGYHDGFAIGVVGAVWSGLTALLVWFWLPWVPPSPSSASSVASVVAEFSAGGKEDATYAKIGSGTMGSYEPKSTGTAGPYGESFNSA